MSRRPQPAHAGARHLWQETTQEGADGLAWCMKALVMESLMESGLFTQQSQGHSKSGR